MKRKHREIIRGQEIKHEEEQKSKMRNYERNKRTRREMREQEMKHDGTTREENK